MRSSAASITFSAMVRHEGDATPEALRILKVRGRSMEPELAEGDRLVVDTARTVPALGELFVLLDGDGLVVKRVEPVRPGDGDDDPARCIAVVEATFMGAEELYFHGLGDSRAHGNCRNSGGTAYSLAETACG